MFLYSKNGRVLLTTSDRCSSRISKNAAEAAEMFVEARVFVICRPDRALAFVIAICLKQHIAHRLQ